MELLLPAVVIMALSEFVIRVNVLQIPRFWYFLFGLTECCCWYQHSDSYTGKYMSVWRDIVTLNTDKNNNVRHTLSLWNRIRCDTKDNVCPSSSDHVLFHIWYLPSFLIILNFERILSMSFPLCLRNPVHGRQILLSKHVVMNTNLKR